MKYCFGVDIGGTSVKLGLFDADGILLEKWEIETRTDDRGQSILPDIADTIQKHMDARSVSCEEVTAIGVGVPAAVCANGISGNAVNLGWQQKDVKQEPEAFIIGGGVSKAGSILLSYLDKHSHIPNSRLLLASLGNDAGIYGAAKFALSQGSL